MFWSLLYLFSATALSQFIITRAANYITATNNNNLPWINKSIITKLWLVEQCFGFVQESLCPVTRCISHLWLLSSRSCNSMFLLSQHCKQLHTWFINYLLTLSTKELRLQKEGNSRCTITWRRSLVSSMNCKKIECQKITIQTPPNQNTMTHTKL